MSLFFVDGRLEPQEEPQKPEIVIVKTNEEVKELEKAGWTVVTDSEVLAGGEV